MESGASPFQRQPSPSYHYNNITVNNYGSNAQIPAEKVKEASGSEDEASELQLQYQQLPHSQPFLSAEKIEKHYTELQVGVGFNAGGPEPPLCDNYRTHKRIGARPIVYTCYQCIPFEARYLCKRCAQKEIDNDSFLHKPDHRMRRWEPTWGFDLSRGLPYIPMASSEMEEFADHETADDIRNLTFESQEYYDDRAVRIFVPAPRGLCHVVLYLEVHPIKNEKRSLDIWDKAKGLINFAGMSEIFGSIGASAHPWALKEPPIEPRRKLDPEPPGKPKKDQIASSKSINLRRGDNFRKPLMLDVYTNPGGDPQESGIEIVLQDEYYESEEFYDRPFRWTLKTISVTHLPAAAPSFASLAQTERYHRQQAQEQRDAREKRDQEYAERAEHAKEQREAYEQRRREAAEHAHETHNQPHANPEEHRGRLRERQGATLQPRPNPVRPSSMPSKPPSINNNSNFASNAARWAPTAANVASNLTPQRPSRAESKYTPAGQPGRPPPVPNPFHSTSTGALGVPPATHATRPQGQAHSDYGTLPHRPIPTRHSPSHASVSFATPPPRGSRLAPPNHATHLKPDRRSVSPNWRAATPGIALKRNDSPSVAGRRSSLSPSTASHVSRSSLSPSSAAGRGSSAGGRSSGGSRTRTGRSGGSRVRISPRR